MFDEIVVIYYFDIFLPYLKDSCLLCLKWCLSVKTIIKYIKSALRLQLNFYITFWQHCIFQNHFKSFILTTSTLRETCPYSEFFWSMFSRIRTKYGEIRSMERYGLSLHFQSECGKIRTRKAPNTDTFHAVLNNM